MTTTRKLLGMGAASLLVMMALMAMVPATLADDKADHGDGNISRTFMYFGNVDWKIPDADDPGKTDPEVGGAGWYDPEDRDNLCFLRLFGLRVGTGFYYDTLRVTTNLVPNEHVAEVGKTLVQVGCPLPDFISDADDGWIGTSGFNVFVSPGVTQSHLLCTDANFGQICTPQPGTAKWELYVCKDNPQGVSFDEGDLLGLGLGLGSSQLAGGKAGTQCQNHNAYDATEYLDSPTFQSGFTPLHLDQLWSKEDKPKGPGAPSAYVVSCYRVEYDIFPKNGGAEQREAKSHDWFLVVKNDGNTVEDLAWHLGLTGPHLLQGLYDLSGDNNCAPNPSMPDDLDNKLAPGDKDKLSPHVTVPGLGNIPPGP